MTLDKHDIENIAKLAKIELSKEQCADTANELNESLNIIERIKTVNNKDSKLLLHPVSIHEEISMFLRNDRDVGCLDNFMEKVITNAPQFEDNMFLVPKTVE
ncbi:aspartyl-tRNA(Asn)/glutamyl-tRNA (Gln) amidotransferase subunit C [Candidatus Kinetoplastibacterium oncopeltii TCC290E]|uniref:Glutamyl-tRNA(Gln) amidotransferase subunit C n=1 Tax=Candidatus Kinetoplastidibacterium stringomonadis TCC290E TaxID=1208920 RepID=M1LZW8_9PROT|nr:Asp-tRNA(Asn)/Glu-tRNA(Gln) amidotransferase subunit GatC [Candidatus Kinetoplastibacterium oncopeltii]AGF48639.1 aspartyl-tRNA(Asn)/glutamyl-tRNA (Gln) amidotransferase subunit C [Candidatus Kinetoplastibacterium oncopeltii TCC290E]